MSFRYHGNYCGPGYTGGKFAGTGDYSVAPTDGLDSLCRDHDFGYGLGDEDLADQQLVKNTRYGLDKEGLLKLGFTLKQKLYNPLFVNMPKNKSKQVAMVPMSAAKQVLSQAFKAGKRLQRQADRSSSSGDMSMSSSSLIPQGMNRSRNRSSSNNVFVYESPKHGEFVADINGSVSLVVTNYNLNPGNATTFPYLSKIAQNFNRYEFEFLEFVYEPAVSQYAAQGQVGKIIMAFDFDAADPSPTTKTQLEDMEPHTDGLPCEYLKLSVNRADLGISGPRYVRLGAVAAGLDIKTYDIGALFLASIANTNTTVAGELHVRYRVRLYDPILSAQAVAAANISVSLFGTNGNESAPTSTVSFTPVLGLTLLNGLSLVNTSGTIALPVGTFLIDYMANATNVSGANLTAAYCALYDVSNAAYLTPAGSAGTPEIIISAGTTEISVSGTWALVNNVARSIKLLCSTTFSAGTVYWYGSIRIALA